MIDLAQLPSLVKICGVTSRDDAEVVVRSGANALGIILAHSPRQVTVEAAREISSSVQGSILRVGVFRHNIAEFVCRALDAIEFDAVQVHGELSAELLSELRSRDLGIIKALSVGSRELGDFDDRDVDAILVDGPTPGSGVTHAWDELSRRVFERPVIVAGGLNPVNVAHVLQVTGAWGVDVASGVESAPGVKDASLVRDFVDNALAYFQQREESRD